MRHKRSVIFVAVTAAAIIPACAQKMFEDSGLIIERYGKSWCASDTANVRVYSNIEDTPDTKRVSGFAKRLNDRILKECPDASSIYIFGRDGTLIRKLIDPDKIRKQQADSNNGEKNIEKHATMDIYNDLMRPFLGEYSNFESIQGYLNRSLSPTEMIDLRKNLKIDVAIRIINSDPRFASLGVQYALSSTGDAAFLKLEKPQIINVQLSPTVLKPAEAAIAYLGALLFFTPDPNTHQTLWSYISQNVSVKAQVAISQATNVIGQQAEKLGIGVRQENVELDNRCRKEEPVALAEAKASAGQSPPAREIIKAEKIKDPTYEGLGWSKWNFDYKGNSLFIQVHYMYKSETKQSDQFKVNFCKPLKV